MNLEDFFVVLPSNTISPIYNNNKIGSYEILLPKALELVRGLVTWEVGLVEMFYPHSWENIHPPFLQVAFESYKNGILTQERRKIEHGFYKTVEDLIDEINSLRPDFFRCKLSVGRANKRVKVLLYPMEKITFHETLATMLGFEQNALPNPSEGRLLFRAERAADIHASMHNIYVYTNIVTETLVGNAYSPLLRIIKTDGEHGSDLHKSFLDPYYHEIAFDRISSIRISLCDDQGEAVRFGFGKVICTLHFRKKVIRRYPF